MKDREMTLEEKELVANSLKKRGELMLEEAEIEKSTIKHLKANEIIKRAEKMLSDLNKQKGE